jgi:hypothetical protein
MPAMTSRLLQAVNFALPSELPGATEKHRGAEVSELEVKPLTVLASAAARRYNQVG